jgi:hypothetical protein
VKAPLAGCPGELDPEAAVLDQPQSDAALPHPDAWDASDGARPAVVEDVHPAHLRPVEDAEKLADLEPGVPVRDDLRSVGPVAGVQLAELCKPAVAPFAARSCVAQVPAVLRVELERMAALPMRLDLRVSR